jgi:diadenylate cyclase
VERHVSFLYAALEWYRGLTPREALFTAVDVGVVYYIIYRVLRFLRGTRAAQMLLGLAFVAACIFAAKQLELTTLSWLLDHLLSFSIIFGIIIFQHDIRRALMRMGQGLWWTSRTYERTEVFEEIIRAAERLASLRVGALIVIERDADLTDHLTEQGIEIRARVTEELLVSIFLPDAENKLHDGAVIVKELRIAQAAAVLPLSANARLDKSLGTRHRAAIGVTEETDAVSVVVSEERGSISLCFGGNVARDLDGATLRKALLGLFQKEPKRNRRRTDAIPIARKTGSHEVVRRPSQRMAVVAGTLPGLGRTRTTSREHLAVPELVEDGDETSSTTHAADVEVKTSGDDR